MNREDAAGPAFKATVGMNREDAAGTAFKATVDAAVKGMDVFSGIAAAGPGAALGGGGLGDHGSMTAGGCLC